MKTKNAKPILIILLMLFCAAVLASCAKEPKVLDTPRSLAVEGETLSWKAVEGASGYAVEIDGEEYECDTNSFSLFLITTKEKKYGIRVLAFSYESGYADSEWSKLLEYTPKLAEGLVFEPEEKGNGCTVGADPQNKPVGKLVIPDKDPATGLHVTSLKREAFKDCKELTAVIIPDSVKIIQSSAFKGCEALTDVKLPRWLRELYLEAFMNCSSLAKIDLPDELEKIGPNAFSGTAISSLTIPANVSVWGLGYGIFRNCPNLTSIAVDEKNGYFYSENNCILKKKDRSLCIGIKTSVIPDYVKDIGVGAFAGTIGLTEIVLPDGMENIGMSAFSDCPDLVSVKLNDGLKSIQESAFKKCPIEKIYIPASVEFIGNGMFSNCENLTDMTIDPANKIYKSDGGCVVRLADSALISCSGSSDYVPAGIKIIESEAFFAHRFHGRLILPEGLEKICTEAFYLSRITSVIMPDSLKEIEADAFLWCYQLKYVELPEGVILYEAFSDGFGGPSIPSYAQVVVRKKTA